MKRHPALAQLSREHHLALVFAKRLRCVSDDDLDALTRLVAEVRQIFARDLEPHFLLEEQHLLPALLACGEQAAVEQTLEEHAALRSRARQSDINARENLHRFGDALAEHVRFEERVLFPLAESVLGEAALKVAWLAMEGRASPARE